jgi:hypothetical protein
MTDRRSGTRLTGTPSGPEKWQALVAAADEFHAQPRGATLAERVEAKNAEEDAAERGKRLARRRR